MHLPGVSGEVDMTEEKEHVIAFEGVSMSFGERPVLCDLNLTVDRGEALCILGRSGIGKSVTLKLMIGLLRPESGKIWIDGDNIAEMEGGGLSRVRRKIGFLFQSAALFDSFNLHDNLALPLRRHGVTSRDRIEELIDTVLRQVGLARDKNKMPSELSGGMKKRAGLARALVLEPQILLVDEPSSGLDRITSSEIDELLLAEKTNRKTTMVIVTHDVAGARRVGDRFVVLEGGCLMASGTAEQLIHSESETVRKLIGES
jgi:phospholipid/cholesterol/gamma-HCH transport system ATP-binding protein